jgi:UDP-glucose 4-epimerase
MKVLVVGGAGYIGSHMVERLLDLGNEVVVFDSLELGHKEVAERLGGEISLFKGDLRKKEDIKNCFKDNPDIEAVVHFAAKSLVGESVEKPEIYYENNVGGSLNLFSAMVEAGVKKIVFSSTAAVYGEPDVKIITEDIVKKPINPYGSSKLFVEQILEDMNKAYGLSSFRLRYFNVAGASSSGLIGEDHHPETHLIPLVLQAALGKREKIVIFGDDYDTEDGTCVRDYIHVEDLIEAHILALNYLSKNEGVSEYVNLGSERGYSVKEVVETVKKVVGVDFKVELGERRAGDPPRLVASSRKAFEKLGWKVDKSLEDMVTGAWKWYKQNPNGYGD